MLFRKISDPYRYSFKYRYLKKGTFQMKFRGDGTFVLLKAIYYDASSNIIVWLRYTL